jgi:methionyl-tRNA formyltransferase
LNYVLFGDESTLPGMQMLLGSRAVLSVIASNRPQAVQATTASTIVQPGKGTAERPQFIAKLKAAKADAFLCFSYSMILDDEILAIPARGAINIHGGMLPRYRGANVLNWAIIEDAAMTGVTAHFMSKGIDEGDVIFSRTTSIADHDTAATLKGRLDELGLALVAHICEELGTGKTLPRVAQDPARAQYYRRRKPDDGLIDWGAMSDRQVFNLIRALVKPWPGAFLVAPDGTRIILDRYHTLEEVAALRARYCR